MGTPSVPGGYTVWSSLWIPALKNMQWDQEFINQKAEGNCCHALKFRADPHVMLQLCSQSTPRSRVYPGSISVLLQGTVEHHQAGPGFCRSQTPPVRCCDLPLEYGLQQCGESQALSPVLCRLADRVLIPTQESAQAMYPERAGPGRDVGWGSWTPCAETLWFVLLPSRLISLELCRRWAISSPLTLEQVGEFRLCWSFLNAGLHPHGTATRMGAVLWEGKAQLSQEFKWHQPPVTIPSSLVAPKYHH